MSKYTTEVRFICEEMAGYTDSQPGASVYDIVSLVAPQIFQNYPIFSEDYRQQLNTKILLHYYTREIGFETVGLWKLKLNQKLAEIMPYYNQLYLSAQLQYNPLFDVDYTVTRNDTDGEGRTVDEGIGAKNTNTITDQDQKTTTTDTTSEIKTEAETQQTANNTEVKKTADTPQVANSEPIFTQYLTNAQEDKQDNALNGTSSTDEGQTAHQISSDDKIYKRDQLEASDTKRNLKEDINRTFEGVQHTAGKMGTASYAKMITEYRQTMLNIDMLIIEELNDLFMGLW